MSKSKVRKPEVDLSPKKGRPDGAVFTDKAFPSAVSPLLNGSPPTDSDVELSEKIKALVRLAQEQGRLTSGDIIEALPARALEQEKKEKIFFKLSALGID